MKNLELNDSGLKVICI